MPGRCTYGCRTFEQCVFQHPRVSMDEIIDCCRRTLGITATPEDAQNAMKKLQLELKREQRIRRLKELESKPYRRMGKWIPHLYERAIQRSQRYKGVVTFEVSHETVGEWKVRCHVEKKGSGWEDSIHYWKQIIDKEESVNDAIQWVDSTLRSFCLAKYTFSKGEEE